MSFDADRPAAPAPRRRDPRTGRARRGRLGKLLDNTASGLLVRHPQGDLLIDGGNSSRFVDEISVYRKTRWLWMRAVPGALGTSRTIVAEAIAAAGADPARLRFLPTHAHLDRVGGLVDRSRRTSRASMGT
jgi:glyoxylase-like metal-dependent hydrolase (beta-lactamase superfamily II)